jgi:hypothetical protein
MSKTRAPERRRYFEDADLPPLKDIPLTDIRSYTRRSDKVRTEVQVWFKNTMTPWIQCGEVELRQFGQHTTPYWELGARMGHGATDFEHDSAWAFKLPLIGVEFESLDYGKVTLRAWVAPSEVKSMSRSFHVPRPGWNPLELPETEKCTDRHCSDKGHPIVPEGLYSGPPFDAQLYEMVRGCAVKIMSGSPRTESDED